MKSMITVKTSGDYSKVTRYLERIKEAIGLGLLDKYGRRGVDVLRAATPVDTGLTADSWSYEIQNDGKTATISFTNSNVNRGVNIAIILQYGHATGTGGWVEGRDYINPAIQPILRLLNYNLTIRISRRMLRPVSLLSINLNRL